MTLVDCETFAVPPRWLLVRLETDEGTVGWGEHVTGGGGPAPVASAVDVLFEQRLRGADAARIEDHWQTMYRGGFYRGGPVLMSAISGIDQALWDLKGKRAGLPVHELLGGRARDRVRVYQWIGGDRPSDVGEAASEKVEEGFTALKMNATGEFRRVESPAAVAAAVARLREVREAVGPDVDVAVDFHGRVAKPMAKKLAAALDPYDPMFVEEPVLSEQVEAFAEVAAHTDSPVATGERLFTRWDFKPLLESGAVDVVQPDLSHAGGITEVRKIAAMAEAYDVALAPHCPLGPVALAACLQVDAATPNALIQEQSLDIHYNREADLLDYLADSSIFEYEDGYVDVPDAPGLGVELDESAVREAAEDPAAVDWGDALSVYRDVWRHEDGSVAEW
ncbi:galactonate dehydratase [Halomarina pelagica]|uniref:galactonate dehydratase n=1 Tax=Halomarina pelagica TaxID=2961599 RepID=UPI0020C259FF|nr:galactonate dehydratase [Halomarina sp. BND7]